MSSDDLEARVRELEDRLAILEIEGQYSMLFDSKQGEAWADLFTEDGVYEGRQMSEDDDPNRPVVRGRDQLIKLCREFPRAGIHLMHVPHILVDGDKASSRVHMQFLSQTEGSGAPAITTMIGYYDVAYVLDGDRWKIKRRVTTTFRRTTSDGHTYPAASALD